MSTGKVTFTSKNCKNCIFWEVHNSDVENDVMRRLYAPNGGQPPARKRHACQLILRAVKNTDGTFKTDDNGDPVKEPLPHALMRATNADEMGPRFGERTGPRDGCQHHTHKHTTYVRPSPHLGSMSHVVNQNDMIHDDLVPLESGKQSSIIV